MGVSNLQFGNVLAQVQAYRGIILPDWVLLDMCSADNVINIIDLLNAVNPCAEEEVLEICTNGGR